MHIVFEKPPNFAAIDRAFHVAGQPILFAWQGIIYNPERIAVPPFLIAHETVHGARQKDDPAGWWQRYIDDPAFRLKEELQAHKAELACICLGVKDRNRRARFLQITASRLAHPIYGGNISVLDAIALLRH